MAQGTAIFNLTRQLGGSIGIAVLATKLQTATAVNRAILVEHIGAYDLDTRERLFAMTRGIMARGGVDSLTAARRAIAALDRTVQGQAVMLSFEGIFRLVGVVMLASLPLVLLLKRPAGGGPGGAH
jgi:DHA2 family multidrug resistance protein